jgi:hypothetical protein
MRFSFWAAAAAAALSFASPAQAAVRVFDFVARVDMLDTFVPTGTMINGSFSYDDSLVPSYSEQQQEISLSQYTGPSVTFVATVGNEALSGSTTASVWNVREPTDWEEADTFAASAKSGNVFYDLSIWQPDGRWLADTRLPVTFPSALWQGPFPDGDADDDVRVPHGEFGYFDPVRDRSLIAVVLSVTSSAVSTGAVPEPATWAMMILGFGLVGGALRSRRRGVAMA